MRRLLFAVFLLGCQKKETPEAAPAAASASAPIITTKANLGDVEAPEVQVRPEGTKVHVTWKTPPGTGVNEDAPVRVRWKHSEGLKQAPPEMKSTGATVKEGFDVPVDPLAGATHATLGGTIDLVVCDTATHRVCVPVKRKLDLGFIVEKSAPAETPLAVQLPEAKP